MPSRVLLVHGAGTTASVWDPVRPHLSGLEVLAPDRPCTGDLEREIAYLTGISDGALLVGVGGGATLGLAMLAAGVPLAGAVLHEPAAGSLVPGLLDDVARAFASGGVPAFAATLYGPAWTPAMAPADLGAVERDLAMFRAFEPARPSTTAHVVTTVGELSPDVRHEVAATLERELALPYLVLPGCRHAVHLEHPAVLAATIRALLPRLP